VKVCLTQLPKQEAQLAAAEIARDADNVDFSVDDMHNALTFARPCQTDRRYRQNRETAIQVSVTQGHPLCQSTWHMTVLTFC